MHSIRVHELTGDARQAREEAHCAQWSWEFNFSTLRFLNFETILIPALTFAMTTMMPADWFLLIAAMTSAPEVSISQSKTGSSNTWK